jgi:hypothetical protein
MEERRMDFDTNKRNDGPEEQIEQRFVAYFNNGR